MMPDVAEHVGACVTCGKPLTGTYCAHCGERVLDPKSLTVAHFVKHALLDELVQLDGKFWRTVRCLLFRPGFLTSEYAAGRRRPYINPVRLLIAAIITYALLTQGSMMPRLMLGTVNLSIAPVGVPHGLGVADTVLRIDRFGLLQPVLAQKAASLDLASEVARDQFHRRLQQFAQPLSFTTGLMLALVLHPMFRHTRALFVHNAVFSVHLVTFILLSSVAFKPAMWWYETNDVASMGIILSVGVWQFTYLTIALRRFYFHATRGSVRPVLYGVVAAVLLYLLNSVFTTLMQTLGAAIALQSI